jgi:hypothetical protein
MDPSAMEKSAANTAYAPREAIAVTRWRAAATHLAISAGIGGAVLALMLAVWYPPPLFQAMGGIDLALILVSVDIVMGPLLTLVVFRSGKPGLKFDLAAIGIVQLAALLYGCHIISLARPAYIVFVKDQFQVATAVELEPERLAEARYPQFRAAPWSGPVFVFGDWPTDTADQQVLVNAALSGEDLQHFPKHYAPYAEGANAILAKAQTLSQLRATEPSTAKRVEEWLARSGVEAQSVRHLSLRGRNAWVSVLIDRQTARPVKLLLADRL